MGYYTNQDLDFVKRTKDIIEQYDAFQIDKKIKYEVTLLLNCLIGLLILPQQRLFNELPKTVINKSEWGISTDDIWIILDRRKRNEEKNILNIARHLRNSVAHYRFQAYPEKIDDIKAITFLDYLNDGTTLSFKVTIKIDDLRLFANKISDNFITKMEISLGIKTSD